MQEPSRSSIGVRRELALELVHATEAAALASARLLGKGDEDRVHEAAGDAMRKVLEDAGLSGTVVLGDRNDPVVPPGTSLSGGEAPLDFGLFPVEGAAQVAGGSANAVSVVVAAGRRGVPPPPPRRDAERMGRGAAGLGARGR